MFSRFFIYRPKFALVISIVITIAGVLGYLSLPVEQFPNITPPVVNVTATYTGANAEVLEETVAAPIEGQVNGVDDMIYMQSTSNDSGNYSLNVTFAVGTDPDIATVNTQNRVSQANSQLPSDVTNNGVTVQKASTNMLLVITLFSPNGSYDPVFLSNYASINLKDALARVPGVGLADVMTDFSYGMRIWLDPDRLTSLGMTPTDFITAVRDQNIQVAAGQIGAPPVPDGQQFQYTIKAKGRLASPEEFEQIVLRTGADGAVVTIGDVARVELGAQVYNASGEYNGKPSTVLAIYQAPGANALQVSENVLARLDELAKNFPPDMQYGVPFNTTDFVQASLNDVITTLFLTFLLVVSVVFIFLGNWRATIIPTVAIPVSLIGTFAVLLALGMTLNTISLFALVLAIGIVVDDAIVVVENVERIIADEGLSPKEATTKAMEQITSPVIATTLVLLAVFVPTIFMPGITGRLYSQFAVTISVSVLISSINALTLSPALCGLILKARSGPPRGIMGLFDRGITSVRNGYTGIIRRLVRFAVIGLAVVAGAVALIVTLGGSLPQGFLPSEDQGYLMVDVQLPDGASLQRTENVTKQVVDLTSKTPGVEDVVIVNGYSILNGATSSNAALVIATMKNWEDRQAPDLRIDAILAKFWAEFSTIPGANIIAFNPPPIPGLGTTGGVQVMLQQTGGGSPQDLSSALGSMIYSANQSAEVGRAYSTFRANVPQVFIDLDREKAKTLGINVSDVFTTLQAYLGSYYINDFNIFGRVYKVMIQAEGKFRDRVEDIGALYVRSSDGTMVPMRSILTTQNVLGPQILTRYNMFRAAAVMADPAPGASTGVVINEVNAAGAEALPDGYSLEWTGTALQQLGSGQIVLFILLLSILFTYLFLVAQYESWTMPIAILMSVSFAILGALVAVFATGGDVNLYTQIGMIMLVGMGAKNAILIVEFAMEQRADGKSIKDAAVEAAHLRFRAVMMTALSFLLGVVPLMTASSAGAASQKAIGFAVFGGMLFATCIGILMIPILYVNMQTMRETVKSWFGGKGKTQTEQEPVAS
ncbi:RND transporter [Roseibium algicola]|jgi:HAE1 family hydrophobic/amphiphilic exporter-1|uniref:Efflux pump membrane transporter n=1 Tax=Roseibium algicola TaxID=2857014 RepID=A0ABN4X145_9HYPH|nr:MULTISPECIES: multidrug efflux RND transporter permease subunit [Stappiaceae]AQQ06626.1 RND transporter [Roseibium aggregatum]MBO9462888.1 efflux RND transporter permease subunit [Labrenzia sp. R5_0]MEC9469448.1 multidrug efflux RND transporter permease subunit [Pseudomonadota bacterium]MEE2865354.1 multidrug efflux RND transporter permease subunit [Pseudomonadota bacterium]